MSISSACATTCAFSTTGASGIAFASPSPTPPAPWCCNSSSALRLALLIDYIGAVRGILRTLIVIPLMLTPVVVGVIWRTMLNYDFGIINYFVRLLGFATD